MSDDKALSPEMIAFWQDIVLSGNFSAVRPYVENNLLEPERVADLATHLSLYVGIVLSHFKAPEFNSQSVKDTLTVMINGLPDGHAIFPSVLADVIRGNRAELDQLDQLLAKGAMSHHHPLKDRLFVAWESFWSQGIYVDHLAPYYTFSKEEFDAYKEEKIQKLDMGSKWNIAVVGAITKRSAEFFEKQSFVSIQEKPNRKKKKSASLS